MLNFLIKLLPWIFDLWKAVKKVYLKMSMIEKTAIGNMSGVIAIINANIDQSAEDIIEAIKAKYPEIDLDGLNQALCEVAKALGNVFNLSGAGHPYTLYETIGNLKRYLSKFQGDTWIAETKKIVTLLAKIYSPETPIQKFFDVLEYVYQEIVKPYIQASAA